MSTLFDVGRRGIPIARRTWDAVVDRAHADHPELR